MCFRQHLQQQPVSKIVIKHSCHLKNLVDLQLLPLATKCVLGRIRTFNCSLDVSRFFQLNLQGHKSFVFTPIKTFYVEKLQNKSCFSHCSHLKHFCRPASQCPKQLDTEGIEPSITKISLGALLSDSPWRTRKNGALLLRTRELGDPRLFGFDESRNFCKFLLLNRKSFLEIHKDINTFCRFSFIS